VLSPRWTSHLFPRSHHFRYGDPLRERPSGNYQSGRLGNSREAHSHICVAIQRANEQLSLIPGTSGTPCHVCRLVVMAGHDVGPDWARPGIRDGEEWLSELRRDGLIIRPPGGGRPRSARDEDRHRRRPLRHRCGLWALPGANATLGELRAAGRQAGESNHLTHQITACRRRLISKGEPPSARANDHATTALSPYHRSSRPYSWFTHLTKKDADLSSRYTERHIQ
jgi:hypothetical protein